MIAFNFFGFGIDFRKIINLYYLPKFFINLSTWLLKGGKINNILICPDDHKQNAASIKNHYFHQDLFVAQKIFESRPEKHIDIGSRIDGFVAHVASFRKIDVIDIRPLESKLHNNIYFHQKNIMELDDLDLRSDSVSCLHTIEHFGMSRYGESINVNGHIVGLKNIIKLLRKGGCLYLSFPIASQDRIEFNAQRVFKPTTILNLDIVKQNLHLINFSYVDDNGEFHLDNDVNSLNENIFFGCGIFIFKKTT